MMYFAKVINGIVDNVIVVEDSSYFDTFIDTSPGKWVQTYRKGLEGRKNYAAYGFTYDLVRDAFIPPQPYPSWVLDEDTCLWDSPIAYPDDGKRYRWNEDTTTWVEIV